MREHDALGGVCDNSAGAGARAAPRLSTGGMRSTMMFNMFCMDTPGHVHQGLWRHPDNRVIDYNDLDMWVDVAKLLDAGMFDAISEYHLAA